MNAMQDQNLSPAQLSLLTQAMLSVARIDGIHPAEAALIGQFYEASRSADMPSTSALLADDAAAAFDAAQLKGSSAEFGDTVVLMALMTAYADGELSAAERAQAQAMANALAMPPARFEALLAQVRDELIGALSHLPDAASVAAVLHELNSTR